MKAFHIEMQHKTHRAEKRVFTVAASTPDVALRKVQKAARAEIRGRWDVRVMAELPHFVM